MDTAEMLVRQIAELDPIIDTGEGYNICRLCGGEDKPVRGKPRTYVFVHEPNCLWVQAALFVEGRDEK